MESREDELNLENLIKISNLLEKVKNDKEIFKQTKLAKQRLQYIQKTIKLNKNMIHIINSKHKLQEGI